MKLQYYGSLEVYPDHMFLEGKTKKSVFVGAFNSIGRICRWSCRLEYYKHTRACTHKHTFVCDGGDDSGIGVLHSFWTHFLPRTTAVSEISKGAGGS